MDEPSSDEVTLGRKVGILGGTFDPPHVGHLVTAMTVLEALDLDEMVLMVAGDPWQKSDSVVASAQNRFDMVNAAVAHSEGLSASRFEVDRPGPTYSVDTLEALAAAEPEARFHLVLGEDAAAGITSWHRWEEVVELATIVVVARPGVNATCPVDCVRVEVPQIDVSSTFLRSRAGNGKSIRFYVPDAVVTLIGERGIYGETR